MGKEEPKNQVPDIQKNDNHEFGIVPSNPDDNESSVTYFEENIGLNSGEQTSLPSPNNMAEESNSVTIASSTTIDFKAEGEPTIIVVPNEDVEETKEIPKRKNLFRKIFSLFKSKKNKNIVHDNVIIIPDSQVEIDGVKPKKRNIKFLLILLGTLVIIAVVNFGSKLFLGETLLTHLLTKNETGIVVNPEKQLTPKPVSDAISVPEEVEPSPEPIPIDQNNVDVLEVNKDNMKANLNSIQYSTEFSSFEYTIDSVEFVEPRIVIKGTVKNKKMDIISINRLVRKLQSNIYSDLKKPFDTIQVELIHNNNQYSWISPEIAVSFIQKLHYEDRNSSQFWWENSEVYANGNNYKRSNASINLYVPAKSPEWDPIPKETPSETNTDTPAEQVNTSNAETPKNTLPSIDTQPVTDSTEKTDSLTVKANSNSETQTSNNTKTQTKRYCSNQNMNKDNDCSNSKFDDIMKDVNLAFDYPNHYILAENEIGENDSNIKFIKNVKATTTSDRITSFQVSYYTPNKKFNNLDDAFKLLTDTLEANNPNIQYAYTDTSDNPLDITFLNKNNQALKGRVYSETKDGKKKYYYVIAAYIDNKIYEFDFTVKDPVTDKEFVDSIVRSSKIGI